MPIVKCRIAKEINGITYTKNISLLKEYAILGTILFETEEGEEELLPEFENWRIVSIEE